MRILLAIAFFTAFAGMLKAQDKPSITKITGIKEKLVLIKKGFPDIKNKLVSKDPNDPLTLVLKVKMGEYDGRYNGKGDRQSLEYRFTDWKLSGTVEDFQAFYRKLLEMLTEIFGDKYKLKEYEPEEKEWSATFNEKDSPDHKSPTNIFVQCNWALYKTVSLTFFGNKTDPK